jgi:DNA-binding beta-propeller fold protein YncE
VPEASPSGPQVSSAGTFESPFNLAFDRRDVYYVAHARGITQVAPGGARDFGPVTTCVGVAVDGNGTIYAADADAKLIRSIGNLNISTTLVTAANGGTVNGVGSAAAFFPWGMAMDPTGNLVFVDRGNHCIRRLSLGGVVTNVAGTGLPGHTDGPAAEASFSTPMNVAFDAVGNLFVTDADLGYIRKITPDGAVSTVAQVPGPAGIAIDASGALFVSSLANVIYRIAPDGTKAVYAGSGGDPSSAIGALFDGPIGSAQFFKPYGVAFSHAGDLYVADTRNNRVRRVK